MKKILFSLMVVMLLIGLVGAGVVAYFYDDETSTGNTFSAGTLDLTTAQRPQSGFSNATPSGTKIIQINNEAPGDSGTGTIGLYNVGTLNGELDIVFGAVANTPGVETEPELADPLNTSGGDLGSYAQMAAYVDVDQSGGWNVGDVGLDPTTNHTYYTSGALVYATVNTWSGKSYSTGTGVVTIPATTGSDDFVLNWNIPTTVGNAIQGDGLTFDVTFTLEQATRD